MTNEFKKISQGDVTRYILESESAGATGSGSIASVPGGVGKVQKRGNLLAQEEKKDAPKPRNFVAKNAKMGGAGQHKDKKKAEKQGDVKHRKPFAEQGVAEGLTEARGSLFAFVKRHFPTWPDYVLKDFLYAQAKGIRDQAELDDFLKRNKQDFGDCKWTLTKLPITFDIFTPKTQRMLASREGGSSNPFQVPRDAERHALQSQMIQQKGVSAEPIIVAKLSNGYDLIEGWHRTIQHLKAFPQGYTGPAWVCTGATYKSESVKQGVAEAVDIGKEWMSDTELDQYVPAQLQQEWRELLGYDRNGNPSALWVNLTGGYEPDVNDPQDRANMVKVANKWFALKKIPNVKFFNVKDADDELEWLVQIGEQGVAESDSGAKYKVRSIGHDAKGDYYISPSTGKKVYKKGVKVGDHENPKTGEHKGVAEEAKHGLYYNVNKRKKAGISRPASNPKAPTAQAWRDAAKTAKNEAFQNDESNLYYRYDPSDGRVKQRMVHNDDERQAFAQGFKDTPEQALRAHGIIRSKFDPKKFVQKQGNKWVPVFPFGKPEDTSEDHSTATGGYGQAARPAIDVSSRLIGNGHNDRLGENPEWYNDEANDMTSSQLKSLVKHAARLRNAVKQMQAHGDTLEPWQQSKVTKAADYLDAVFNAVDDDIDMGESNHPDEKEDKALIRKMVKQQALKQEDSYMAELQAKLAEKIPKNAPVDVYIKDFEKSNAPQFRGKTKEKRRQMAVAASYSAKNPSKKKK